MQQGEESRNTAGEGEAAESRASASAAFFFAARVTQTRFFFILLFFLIIILEMNLPNIFSKSIHFESCQSV
jgi:hypothetical protein